MRVFFLSCLTLGSLACGTATSPTIGSSALGSQAVVANKKHVTVKVSPDQGQIQPGATLQLEASVSGTTDESVSWSAEAGTIDDTGLYTAPSEAGTYEVTATSHHLSTAFGTATIVVGAPSTPPPSTGPGTLPPTCYRTGQAVVDGTVTVTQYNGLQHGYNGTHEIVIGSLAVSYSSDSSVLSDVQVQLALNVASAKDSSGLPQEIPLNPGDTFEVQGVYIPPALAQSQYAIVHFTHAPCGFVTINGNEYQ